MTIDHVLKDPRVKRWLLLGVSVTLVLALFIRTLPVAVREGVARDERGIEATARAKHRGARERGALGAPVFVAHSVRGADYAVAEQHRESNVILSPTSHAVNDAAHRSQYKFRGLRLGPSTLGLETLRCDLGGETHDVVIASSVCSGGNVSFARAEDPSAPRDAPPAPLLPPPADPAVPVEGGSAAPGTSFLTSFLTLHVLARKEARSAPLGPRFHKMFHDDGHRTVVRPRTGAARDGGDDTARLCERIASAVDWEEASVPQEGPAAPRGTAAARGARRAMGHGRDAVEVWSQCPDGSSSLEVLASPPTEAIMRAAVLKPQDWPVRASVAVVHLPGVTRTSFRAWLPRTARLLRAANWRLGRKGPRGPRGPPSSLPLPRHHATPRTFEIPVRGGASAVPHRLSESKVMHRAKRGGFVTWSGGGNDSAVLPPGADQIFHAPFRRGSWYGDAMEGRGGTVDRRPGAVTLSAAHMFHTHSLLAGVPVLTVAEITEGRAHSNRDGALVSGLDPVFAKTLSRLIDPQDHHPRWVLLWCDDAVVVVAPDRWGHDNPARVEALLHNEGQAVDASTVLRTIHELVGDAPTGPFRTAPSDITLFDRIE